MAIKQVRTAEMLVIVPATLLSLILLFSFSAEIAPRLIVGAPMTNDLIHLFSIVAVLAGVVSLWLAVLCETDFYVENRKLAIFVVFGLVVGCIVAVYVQVGIVEIANSSNSNRGIPWGILAIFNLPVLVGFRHIHRIWKTRKLNSTHRST